MKKTLIPLSILAMLALVGCGGTQSSDSNKVDDSATASTSVEDVSPTSNEESGEGSKASQESEDPVTYGVTITNKENLTAEWKLGENSRTISISVTPAANVQVLLRNGDLTIVSSAPEVVSVDGTVLSAVGTGNATITVTYHDQVDTVDIEVASPYHGGHISDPLTVDEALAIAGELAVGKATEVQYYIKGTITDVLTGYVASKKAPTFYMGGLYIYQMSVNSDEIGAHIVPGAEVVVHCALYNYQGTLENSSGEVLSATGGEAVVQPTEGKGYVAEDPLTVAEARERAAALEANHSDPYFTYIRGVVTEITESYGSFKNMTFKIADSADGTETIECYRVSMGEEDAAKILEGATIVFYGNLKNYASTSSANTTIRINMGGFVLVSAEGGEAYVPLTGHGYEATDPYTISEVKAIIDAGEVNAHQEIFVKGVIYDVKSGTNTSGSFYCNVFIKDADDESITMELYGVACDEEEAAKYLINAPIVAKGFPTKYKETYELNSGCTIVEIGKVPEVEPAERPDAVDATIAELLDKTAADTAQTYNVEGIWEAGKGDKYGNGYLTDPVTGKSIQVYGATTTEAAITFDGTSGSPVFSYNNKEDALTTLAGLENGMKVTGEAVLGIYKDTPQVSLLVKTFEEYVGTFSISYEATDGNLIFPKTENIAYGEEITVEAVPDEGKVLQKLTVENAQGVKTDITESKKFNATVVNKVVAEFVDDDDVLEFANMAYPGGTTANMVGEGKNNAATVGLDAELFTVVADKGAATNLPGLNKDGTIRLYAKDGNGNNINVSIADGYEIDSIVIEFASGADHLQVETGEDVIVGNGGTYLINGNEFTLTNVGTAQVQIKKVTIGYRAVDDEGENLHTYGLVGKIEGVAAWDDDIAMTVEDGVAKVTQHFNVDDEFKVRLDGAWDESYGGANLQALPEALEGAMVRAGEADDCNVLVLKAGTYTIAVDITSGGISVTGTLDDDEEEDVSYEQTLTNANTVKSDTTNYSEWTTEDMDGITYDGQSAGGSGTIQLRSKNNNSGIVVTANENGLKVAKISIVWNAKTVDERVLNVYGSSTPYTAPSDLYGNNSGTFLFAFEKGGFTEYTIEGDFSYIGFRSDDGALYLDSITITWVA